MNLSMRHPYYRTGMSNFTQSSSLLKNKPSDENMFHQSLGSLKDEPTFGKQPL